MRFKKYLTEDKKSIDMVKRGKVSSLSDDDLFDAVGDLENIKWNKDNRDAVKKWVKAVEKELKKRGFSGPKIKPMFEGWTKTGSEYATELSDIEAHIRGKKQDIRCPKCRNPIKMKELMQNPQRDRTPDRELTHWKPICPTCRAKLVVFND